MTRTGDNIYIEKNFNGSFSQMKGKIKLVEYNPLIHYEDNVGIVYENGYTKCGFCKDHNRMCTDDVLSFNYSYYLTNRWMIGGLCNYDVRLGICQRCVDIFTS